MKLQNVRRMIMSMAVAGMYAIAIGVTSIALPANTASAEAVLPAPAIPSSTCEWYGEMHYLETHVYDNNYDTQQRDLNRYWKWDAVSAPVAGESCGMVWSSKFDSYLQDRYLASCTADLTDWTVNTSTQTGDGDGTGRFTTDMFSIAGDPAKTYLKVNGTGLTTNGTYSAVLTNTVCGQNYSSTGAWKPAKTNADCEGQFFDKTNMFSDPDATIVEGSCTMDDSYHSVRENSEYHKKFSWKFTRANQDSALPTITLNAPLDGGSVVLGTDVHASYTCQDEAGGSGLASCVGGTANGAALDTSTIGAKTFTVTATDNAGNVSTATANYTVIFQNSGFLNPIDANAINKTKAGQTVPVKFRLLDSSGAAISDSSSFVNITSAGVVCSAGDLIDEVEQYTGNSGLQYLGDGYWQYNWKTAKAYAGQCRVLYLTLADGTATSARFQF